MRSYRKPGDAYVEIYLRDRGPADHPDLTIEIQSSFNEEFKDSLKTIPYAKRHWDGEVWRVHPDYQATVEALAKKYYRSAHRIHGEETLDLHTGVSYAQRGLF